MRGGVWKIKCANAWSSIPGVLMSLVRGKVPLQTFSSDDIMDDTLENHCRTVVNATKQGSKLLGGKKNHSLLIPCWGWRGREGS
jgi:hypothetical protein